MTSSRTRDGWLPFNFGAEMKRFFVWRDEVCMRWTAFCFACDHRVASMRSGLVMSHVGTVEVMPPAAAPPVVPVERAPPSRASRKPEQSARYGMETAEETEQAHVRAVIASLRRYRPEALTSNNKRRSDFYQLSLAHQDLLGQPHKDLIKNIDGCILANARFLALVADTASEGIFISEGAAGSEEQQASHAHSHNREDASKVRSTLKQFAREWSSAGARERRAVYDPMLEALEAHFVHTSEPTRTGLHCLVPGAGLGRLVWETAKRGFSAQGNEFSMLMLLASDYLLNHSDAVEQHTIYPFAHSLSNLPARTTALQPVRLPDVLPSDLPPVDFSMTAGDFVEIYGTAEARGQWNAILTSFFIDTARNVIEYLETIHNLLADDGIWINCGPLLWHFEQTPGETSIEMPLDDLKRIITSIGFDMANERMIETMYTDSADMLMQHRYTAAFWTCTKRRTN
ncbi:uncharacterized protein L969DRAFT_49634 [Mixia osmundae IAM 14324]|uniref:carnosine N-methyltransferase n=1 Tax=Mixia osmundae (strain CBS 9802 / IAM 14324 / JCM 22182 / KY 12970) TaxID=764103 RepID=G7DZT0_MIXOS|nr:uncharacterized protein L969DRAFT_49634 [Mixia osmundae IAM 14324]KEI39250.1 hypothetical protein L969DRAFT_49634 [Mixia osmundae IAM 14324]GAA96090.1 hypothetical protein E5Q_02751 [Mixia osmundae IAM 14324]